ncbi:hypothetical protein NQZ68_042425 [Dissostichus eleginoides]|nr:hypothetical protein NQZ68_042425 [Dissostichus eleginoides]
MLFEVLPCDQYPQEPSGTSRNPQKPPGTHRNPQDLLLSSYRSRELWRSGSSISQTRGDMEVLVKKDPPPGDTNTD